MSLIDLPLDISDGYWPSTSQFPPEELQRTIKAGLNVWLRDGGRLQEVNGPLQISAVNVGARIFAANNDRAVLAGALVGTRQPYASVLRYQNAVLFFLSELVSQQLYLNEAVVAGATTSAIAGQLRVAVPASPTTYNTFDAGFDPPAVPGITTVTGTKGMTGETAVSLCAWRSSTNATSAPSEPFFATLDGGANSMFLVPLPAPVAGQDGFVLGGTDWGDTTATLLVRRYIYIVPRGTFTATNGNGTIVGDADTRWLQDLQVGDYIDIDSSTYQITGVINDFDATITPVFGGVTGGGKTMTMLSVVGEWYDGEDGPLLPYDVLKPVRAAGVFQFMGRVFLWGTDGAIGGVTGPGIRITLETNPEHTGLFVLLTTLGDDLLNVLPGDQTCYLMTANTLEVMIFTGNPQIPFRTRVLHQPGFRAGTNGVVYKNRFYGFSQRPLRTVTDADIDVEFGKAVWTDMVDWDPQSVLLAVDPKNEAVLYTHYDTFSNLTTIIPFMAQLESIGRPKWGPPQRVTGRIVDTAVVNGALYLTLLNAGNYRVNQWEAGAGVSGAYMATQYISSQNRFKVKNIVFTGMASTLYIFVAQPGQSVPFQNVPGSATASFNLPAIISSSLYEEIFTNLPPGKAVAFRADFPNNTFTIDGVYQNTLLRVMPLEERR